MGGRRIGKLQPGYSRASSWDKIPGARERIAQLREEQGGRCALCDRTEQEIGRRLYVDHDHDTMVIRGLLCVRCNTGIGLLGDNAERLRRARDYIIKCKESYAASIVADAVVAKALKSTPSNDVT